MPHPNAVHQIEARPVVQLTNHQTLYLRAQRAERLVSISASKDAVRLCGGSTTPVQVGYFTITSYRPDSNGGTNVVYFLVSGTATNGIDYTNIIYTNITGRATV